jgi:hypothetical protein
MVQVRIRFPVNGTLIPMVGRRGPHLGFTVQVTFGRRIKRGLNHGGSLVESYAALPFPHHPFFGKDAHR